MIIVRIGMAHSSTLNATSMNTSGETHGTLEYDPYSRRATLQVRHHVKPLAVEVMQFRKTETDLASVSDSDSLRRTSRRQRDVDDMDAETR